MGNFQGGGNRGGGFRNGGGKPNFHKKSFGGDRGASRDHEMFKATCSECGKSCEVPFRPSGDKPVYCKDCFNAKRGDDDRAPRKDFGDRGPKRDFNASRDVRTDFKPSPAVDDTKKQLSDINMKLDRLLSAIEKMSPQKMEAPNQTKISITKTASAKKVIKAPVSKKKVVTKKKK